VYLAVIIMIFYCLIVITYLYDFSKKSNLFDESYISTLAESDQIVMKQS